MKIDMYNVLVLTETNNILYPSPSLRVLLKAEEDQYVSEMAGKQETPLERQAKMRERARMLRERREAERLALVEKKLDQRWR